MDDFLRLVPWLEVSLPHPQGSRSLLLPVLALLGYSASRRIPQAPAHSAYAEVSTAECHGEVEQGRK